MRALFLIGTITVAATLAAAGAPSWTRQEAAPPTSAARARATGTVSGKVTVVENEAVRDSPEVVVYIVGPPNDENVPPTTAEIVQTDDLRFTPDLLVITVGDSVAFPNRGVKVHNVYSPRPRFHLDSIRAGESKAHRFNERGVVEVYCDLHPTKAATIIVAPNRHHARVNDGVFRIDNVPVGDWELFAYTRRAIKPTRTRISVTPSGVAVDLSIARGAAARP